MALTMLWIGEWLRALEGLRRRGRTAGRQPPTQGRNQRRAIAIRFCYFELKRSQFRRRKQMRRCRNSHCGSQTAHGTRTRRGREDQLSSIKKSQCSARAHRRALTLDTGRGGGSILFTE